MLSRAFGICPVGESFREKNSHKKCTEIYLITDRKDAIMCITHTLCYYLKDEVSGIFHLKMKMREILKFDGYNQKLEISCKQSKKWLDEYKENF